MVGLPDGEKNLKIRLFILTKFTNVKDGHTYRQTPHDGIGCAYARHRAAKISTFVFQNIMFTSWDNRQWTD